jgi:hypothetical protein
LEYFGRLPTLLVTLVKADDGRELKRLKMNTEELIGHRIPREAS